MSVHNGYGGRAGSGGHGLPVPVEPLRRPGRDVVTMHELADAHRARFGDPNAPAQPAEKPAPPRQPRSPLTMARPEMVAAYQAGASIGDLAKRYGADHTTIKYHLTRAGAL